MNKQFVLAHLHSNEPIFLTTLPILSEVYIKCIPKGARGCSNFELITKCVVDEFGEPLFDSSVIKQVLSVPDSYIIAANIKSKLQELSPDINEMSMKEYNELLLNLNKNISRLDVVKCSYVERINEYYSDCSICNLSDIRFMIYVEMRKKIK